MNSSEFPSDQLLRALAAGLMQNDQILRDWEQRVTGGLRVRHPLISRVRAVRGFCNVLIACGRDMAQEAEQHAQFADRAIAVWMRMAQQNTDEWGEIEEKAGGIVSDLHDTMLLVAEEATAALLCVTQTRAEAYHQGTYNPPDEATRLVYRAHGMLLCGEAIMLCTATRDHAALDWVKAARNTSKAVLSIITVWQELGHLMDNKGNTC